LRQYLSPIEDFAVTDFFVERLRIQDPRQDAVMLVVRSDGRHAWRH